MKKDEIDIRVTYKEDIQEIEPPEKDGGDWSWQGVNRTLVEFKKLIKCKREEATGMGSSSLYYELDRIPFPMDTQKNKLYMVVARYSDGDTFGRREGYWEIEGVFETIVLANKFIKNNKENIKNKHDHYFGGLEDIEIHEVVYENWLKDE